MKISVVVSWPSGFDFPIFRSKLPELLNHVHEVVICFTDHGSYNLRPWLKENMKHERVKFLDVNQYEANKFGGDWRNKSTNLAIENSTGDYILSLEQDFLINDYPHFFHIVDNFKYLDVITFKENERFHPAFLLVKRSVLDKTTRNFSVLGQDMDHFWKFSKELKSFANFMFLSELGLQENIDWSHMRGLTDNYFSKKPYFDLDNFSRYNKECMTVTPMSDYWRQEMERCNV